VLPQAHERELCRRRQGLTDRQKKALKKIVKQMAKVLFMNVTKHYGNNVVIPDLNLEIPDGEFAVLVGPSGCGKTTTLQMVAGLETISSGTLLIGDRDVTDLPPKARDIAMVFQSYALFPHLNVRNNIAFGLKIRKVPKRAMDEQVKSVAERLRIESFLGRLPKALSGGQRQRVALARAVVSRPSVFLMDEPLSNLDAKLRIEARSFLSKMHRELQTTTVYVTHDQSEAMTMGTKIVLLNEGRIQQAAPPLEVYNHPANQFVASFIGSPAMNFLTLSLENDSLVDSTAGIQIPLTGQMRTHLASYRRPTVVLGVRPEALRPLERDLPVPANSVRLAVDVIQHLGHEILLDASDGTHRIVARVPPGDDSGVGERRPFVINMDMVHLFDVETGLNLASAGS
jgi:multiple sugar transport system ATP-binding protein